LISTRKGQQYWVKMNFRFLLTMLLISTIINTLFVHIGNSVIFSLPEKWLLIGGNITLESLVYGLINGLVIGSLYLVFNILNLTLSTKQITRLIPSALRPVAMTATVALTFFPSIQQRAREIKEAQMIRGHSMKRIVDWVPLIIPLLVTSLEKAFLLAESMTARGFQVHREPVANKSLLIGMVLGTFTIFSGWILRLYKYPLSISILLYVFGGLIFVFVFWCARRSIVITRYYHEKWHQKEIMVSGLFALSIILVIVLHLTRLPQSFSYSPYPTIQAPGFQWMGLAMGLLPLFPEIFKNDD
ncbi:MAG: energy-coupling factor transporter transmembrane component T, partial [Brevefilum sp.]